MDGKKAKWENLAIGKGSPGNPVVRDTRWQGIPKIGWYWVVGVSQPLFFKGTDGRTTSVMFSTCWTVSTILNHSSRVSLNNKFTNRWVRHHAGDISYPDSNQKDLQQSETWKSPVIACGSGMIFQIPPHGQGWSIFCSMVFSFETLNWDAFKTCKTMKENWPEDWLSSFLRELVIIFLVFFQTESLFQLYHIPHEFRIIYRSVDV